MSEAQSAKSMHVAIIGGGIGGLCLAQGLKKAGVCVTVFERDRTPASRLQGYRIHIDPQGSRALYTCLPERLWSVFDKTGGEFSQSFTLLTEQLVQLLRLRDHRQAEDAIEKHRSVSRITLRSILLSGLEDSVCFDKRFMRYEQRADGTIVAHFEDGSSAEANVLIAADGVNSAVRKQYLPGNDPVDTGVAILGGKVPLTDGVMALMPEALLTGPAIVLPPEPTSLFMAAWRRSRDAAARIRDFTHDSEDEKDYLILGMGARRDFYNFPHDPETMSAESLRQVMRGKVTEWHPNLRKLVELVQMESGVTNIRTSRPLPSWPATNITLLGDAIHAMTPYRGIGANTALRDAELLCSKLIAVERGEQELIPAISAFETAMRDYGFAAVEASRKSLEQAVCTKTFGFKIAISAMRAANSVPAIRKRILARA